MNDSAAGGDARADVDSGVSALCPDARPRDMQVIQLGSRSFFLFLDIFVHWSGRKITAVAPYYGSDIHWAAFGIDFENVVMTFGDVRIKARYVPHGLDTWEPSILFDFEDEALAAHLRDNPTIAFTVSAGSVSKDFVLGTSPEPGHEVAMSLIVRDCNRWLAYFLDYYLTCLGADHIYLYDNHTADSEELAQIVRPYVDDSKVTYIPWHYRWRNTSDGKQIGQIPQEAHSLNKFGRCRWIGFFDYDEFLRIPGQSLKTFLAGFDPEKVDGLSFGLRWFMCKDGRSYEDIGNPLLCFLHAKRDPLGRKRQKLIVSPRDVRFLRIHWLEDGKHEVAVDDTDIFFHHYYLAPERFENGKSEPDATPDDYMLGFAESLIRADRKRDGGKGKGVIGPRRSRPCSIEEWIAHVLDAFETAEAESSKLSSEVLAVRGMCGRRNRHFLNALCAFEGCRHLEVGSHAGASLCAAMFRNQISAVTIDDWSQFGGPRDEFIANVEAHRGDCSLRLIEQDCFTVDASTIGPFDMFLYDGSHAAADQRRAIEHFYDSLDEWAVVVIDDWNWPGVRDGTREGMKALDIPVVFEKEIILPAADVVDMPHHRGRDSWWNGIFVMVVDKRAVPLSKSQRSRTIAISTKEAEVETPPLEVIVFSKDRACQLEALLRSMGLFFEYPHRLTVLYTTSNPDYQRAYDILAERCEGVAWQREADFRSDLLRLVDRAAERKARHIMFLVDDIVFIRRFRGAPMIEMLESDDDILAVSLRLGDDIRYCYTLGIATSPPDFLVGRRWSWRGASPGDWDYPMSVDGNIYRLEDAAETLAAIDFRNPNTLEATMAGRPIDRPYLVCDASPCLVNLALNLVQDVFNNRHGDISAETLNRAFLDGQVIDIEPFVGGKFSSCHIEPEISFVRQTTIPRLTSPWRQTGPDTRPSGAASVGHPASERGGVEVNKTRSKAPVVRSASRSSEPRLPETFPTRRRFVVSRPRGNDLVLKRRFPRKAVRLNPTGKIVWSMCDGHTPVESIIEALELTFADASGSLRRDVVEILKQLESHGLLTVRRSPRRSRHTRHVDLRSIPIYVINCRSNIIRRKRVEEQLSHLGLRFEFVDAMECEPSFVGTAVSHLRVLNRKDIKPPFAILEDDCVFNEYFRYRFAVPAATDAFYLGVSYFGIAVPGELSWGRAGRVKWTRYDNANLRVSNMLAAHAIVYLSDRFQRAAIKAMVDALAHPNFMYPCDVGLASIHPSYLVLTPLVPICYQAGEFGGNQGATQSALTRR